MDNDCKEIEEEKDTLTRIVKYDERYNKLSKSLTKKTKTGRKKRKRKQKKPLCYWCKNREAISIGLCPTCRTKHYTGTLLCVDGNLFNQEEAMELYMDVIEFSKKADMTVGEASAYLIAEGLNSFDRRMPALKRKRKRGNNG
jgi:ferredoxin